MESSKKWLWVTNVETNYLFMKFQSFLIETVYKVQLLLFSKLY